MANADVEDDGQFRKCAIYAHRSGGGHSIYFEEGDDYEGMGPGQCCGFSDRGHIIVKYIKKISLITARTVRSTAH